MQGWIVGAVWAGAVVFGVIVLGFTAYEVTWKARRLDGDRRRLEALVKQLAAIKPASAVGPPNVQEH